MPADFPNTKAPRKKRRRKPVRKEPVYYVVEIEEWEWSFTFGVNNMRNPDDPYSDYRHLHFRGHLLRPSKLKAEPTDLVLLPHDGLNKSERQRDQPRGIGSLQRHRGRLEAIQSIPSDALPSLLQMAIAERFRFAVLEGERLHYNQARLRSCRLEMKIEDDDLPPES